MQRFDSDDCATGSAGAFISRIRFELGNDLPSLGHMEPQININDQMTFEIENRATPSEPLGCKGRQHITGEASGTPGQCHRVVR